MAVGLGGRDRDPHVGLGDVRAGVGAIGQDAHRPLGGGPPLGVAADGDAAAGGLDQHVECVFQQGCVAALGTGHRAGGGLGQGQELLAFGRAQAASSSTAPARLLDPAEAILTGTIWPSRRSGASA